MTRVIAIAGNTFREALRDKALYVLLVFSAVLVVSTRIMSPLALGEGVKITKDLGLSAISFFGMLAIIVMGAGLVHKEIDRKTIFVILSKPVARHEFILGKFLGMADALIAMVVLMLIVLQGTLLISRAGLDVLVLKAGFLTYIELLLMTSIAVLFSSFSTTGMSTIFTFAFYVVGHFSGDVLAFGARLPSAFAQHACQFLYYVLPDLQLFNVRGMVVHGVDVPTERILAATAYGLLYSLGALLLSTVVFSRRDFK
ncbi:MAG: ABC transporter permease subunit [Candidatus Eisenbacteria bacterium]|nr:ABC transporter permease subunit [Candidatus Eisenbacteria bacterium]